MEECYATTWTAPVGTFTSPESVMEWADDHDADEWEGVQALAEAWLDEAKDRWDAYMDGDTAGVDRVVTAWIADQVQAWVQG